MCRLISTLHLSVCDPFGFVHGTRPWVRQPAATALLTTQGFYDYKQQGPSVPNLCCLEWLQVWPGFVGHDGGPPAVRPRSRHRQRLVLGDCRDARPLRHCLVLCRVLSRYVHSVLFIRDTDNFDIIQLWTYNTVPGNLMVLYELH